MPDLVVPGAGVPDTSARRAPGQPAAPAGDGGAPSGAGRGLLSGTMGVLRAGTADLHEALERDLDWESRVATLDGYRGLLARWWGVHAAAEPGLAAAFADDPRDRAFHEPRRKLPLLARDLGHLGLTEAEVAALPLCPALVGAGAEGTASALGALYVFEGSSLGGQIMARHLARAHGLTRETGAAFLSAYPPGEVGPMWRAFRERAEAEGADESAREAMLAAARRTFAAVRDWLTA